MPEADCQNALYRWCDHKRHRHIVPNVTVFGWESDLVSVTKAGLICEYEIKCSRSDFLQDKKKYRHRHFTEGLQAKYPGHHVPAYFFYALTRDVKYEEPEIPEYAGLLIIHSAALVTLAKPAPRLHKRGMTDPERQWLERSIINRYWKHRLRNFK